jgi:hypothetical protein
MSPVVRLGTPLLLLLPLTAAAAEADRYLPNDTKAVVHINVRQLADTDFFKKFFQSEFQAMLKKNDRETIVKLMTTAGVEPLRDIRSVTLSLTGIEKDSPDVEVTGIIHGTANVGILTVGLEALVLKNSETWAKHTQDGLSYFEAGKRDKEGSTIFLAFLDRDTLFVTQKKDRMVEAIAKATNKKKTVLDKGLQTLVTRTNAKQQFWVTSLSPWFLKSFIANHAQLMEYDGQIQSFTFGLSLQNGAAVDFRIQMTDAKKADSFRGLWEALVGDLTRQLEKNPFAELRFPGSIDPFFTWLDALRQASPHAVKELLKVAKVTSEKGTIIIDSKLTAAKLNETLKMK